MTHSFQYNAHNLLELFEGTTRFSGRGGWKSKMEAQSTLNENKYPKIIFMNIDEFIEQCLK